MSYGNFGEKPSIIPCIIFSILFGPMMFLHLYIMIKKKCIFWWPFLLGLICEIVGCIVRIFSRKSPDNIPLFAVQEVCLLLPASLFAASIYMILGRLLTYIKAESASIVSVRWMTGFFVIGDVISFLSQAGGGAMQSSDSANTRDIGSKVVIAGLSVQLVFFNGFIITAAIADYRLRKMNHNPHTPGNFQWTTMFNMLYLASVIILVRSIFRMVEFAEGVDGPVMNNEVYMWVLDVTLMYLVGIIFSVVHPAYVLVKDQWAFMDSEMTEASDDRQRLSEGKATPV